MNEEDLKEIKKFYKFMLKENLLELTLQDKGVTLKLKRKNEQQESTRGLYPSYGEPSRTAQRKSNVVQEEVQVSGDTHKIVAPLGGVFYRAPAPGADSFVTEGDVIRQGQTLCIIEAMKVMNEIQSEISGKIVRIMPENGKRVNSGETLFLVIPA